MCPELVRAYFSEPPSSSLKDIDGNTLLIYRIYIVVKLTVGCHEARMKSHNVYICKKQKGN